MNIANVPLRMFEKVSWKLVIVLVLGTQLVYALILWFTIPSVMEHSQGMKLLDMMPLGYPLEYPKQLLDALGEEGRKEYLTLQLPADAAYPLLFALSFSFLAVFLLKRGYGQKMLGVVWVPIGAGLFDYAENLCILIMLMNYPSTSPLLAMIASLCTVCKSIFTTITFLIVFWLTGVGIVRMYQRKKNKKKKIR
jgi:hypothetical protein